MVVSVTAVTGAQRPEDGEVRVFESARSRADRAALAHLQEGIRGADLAAAAVVLPDFHHKSTMEMPSSIAVATRDSIRPLLSSSSLNCGMALIALDMERPHRQAIEDFFRRVKERYPFPRSNRRELSAADVLRCAVEGGQFAVERFGLEAADLHRVEEGGRIELEAYGGAERARRELPWTVVQLSRLRFGTIGPTNHFVELQEVEEVLDPGAASILGVHEGQVTLQYHGGGGVLTTEIGALFGRRKRTPRPVRMQMAVQRPMHHLASARSLRELRTRLALYFIDGCPPVARDSDEGRRLMLANTLAMNYGFAFRLSTYANLLTLARLAFGARGGQLVVDSPHNSIYDEEVDGEMAVVHRHNSCRAYPASKMGSHPVYGRTGQAVLLPGTNRTSSYLCAADDGSKRSLYSACHGSGETIDDFAARALSGLDPLGRRTLRFGYSDAAPAEVPQLDDRGVDEALGILVGNRLVRPIARLRPFAVLN